MKTSFSFVLFLTQFLQLKMKMKRNMRIFSFLSSFFASASLASTCSIIFFLLNKIKTLSLLVMVSTIHRYKFEKYLTKLSAKKIILCLCEKKLYTLFHSQFALLCTKLNNSAPFLFGEA